MFKIPYIINMKLKLLMEAGKKKDQFTIIRALMALHNIRPMDIARAAKVSAAMVSRVIRGVDKSRHVQQVISLQLGVPYDELWGD